MKWPQVVPYMRSAKQAIYVRQLTWNYVRDNPNLTYHEMQFYIDRIDHLTMFIAKRSISLPAWYALEDDFYAFMEKHGLENTILMLSRDHQLSQRQIKFLLRKEIQYEKRTGTN